MTDTMREALEQARDAFEEILGLSEIDSMESVSHDLAAKNIKRINATLAAAPATEQAGDAKPRTLREVRAEGHRYFWVWRHIGQNDSGADYSGWTLMSWEDGFMSLNLFWDSLAVPIIPPPAPPASKENEDA